MGLVQPGKEILLTTTGARSQLVWKINYDIGGGNHCKNDDNLNSENANGDVGSGKCHLNQSGR